MGTGHERDVVEVCRAIEAICNRGELAVADALFTADYVNHGGLIPDLVRGPEALKVAIALYRAAFPDFQVTVVPLRTRGSTVLLRWTARPRPAKELAAGTFAGVRHGVRGFAKVRLTGGRIAESWTRWDTTRALRQLGLITER